MKHLIAIFALIIGTTTALHAQVPFPPTAEQEIKNLEHLQQQIEIYKSQLNMQPDINDPDVITFWTYQASLVYPIEQLLHDSIVHSNEYVDIINSLSYLTLNDPSLQLIFDTHIAAAASEYSTHNNIINNFSDCASRIASSKSLIASAESETDPDDIVLYYSASVTHCMSALAELDAAYVSLGRVHNSLSSALQILALDVYL